jgi:hypothetical protein
MSDSLAVEDRSGPPPWATDEDVPDGEFFDDAFEAWQQYGKHEALWALHDRIIAPYREQAAMWIDAWTNANARAIEAERLAATAEERAQASYADYMNEANRALGAEARAREAERERAEWTVWAQEKALTKWTGVRLRQTVDAVLAAHRERSQQIERLLSEVQQALPSQNPGESVGGVVLRAIAAAREAGREDVRSVIEQRYKEWREEESEWYAKAEASESRRMAKEYRGAARRAGSRATAASCLLIATEGEPQGPAAAPKGPEPDEWLVVYVGDEDLMPAYWDGDDWTEDVSKAKVYTHDAAAERAREGSRDIVRRSEAAASSMATTPKALKEPEPDPSDIETSAVVRTYRSLAALLGCEPDEVDDVCADAGRCLEAYGCFPAPEDETTAAAAPHGGAEHRCYACLSPSAPRPGAYCPRCEALRQTTLVCTACGDYPARAALIPADAKPGDQCPCCFVPDIDCDGTLIDSKSARAPHSTAPSTPQGEPAIPSPAAMAKCPFCVEGYADPAAESLYPYRCGTCDSEWDDDGSCCIKHDGGTPVEVET